jgi:hypothetical protein
VTEVAWIDREKERERERERERARRGEKMPTFSSGLSPFSPVIPSRPSLWDGAVHIQGSSFP